MPRTPKIHLAITGTHRGVTFTRSLCDNGGGSTHLAADLSLVPREDRCLSCINRIPLGLAWNIPSAAPSLSIPTEN